MPLIVPGITPVPKSNVSASSTPSKSIPALLVVDMQNDFVTGSLAVPGAPEIVEGINYFLPTRPSDASPFAIIIGTKDVHPPNHISFASRHKKSVGDKVTIYRPGENDADGLEQVLWPDHCVKLPEKSDSSQDGSDWVTGLRTHGLIEVTKGTDSEIESYSAFQDPWKIHTSELPTLLSSVDVTDVYLMGVAADYCVKYTAIDAVKFGFNTWVVRDLVKSVASDGREWEEMWKNGVKTLTSEELKEKLGIK